MSASRRALSPPVSTLFVKEIGGCQHGSRTLSAFVVSAFRGFWGAGVVFAGAVGVAVGFSLLWNCAAFGFSDSAARNSA